jgi:hypothetical protein
MHHSISRRRYPKPWSTSRSTVIWCLAVRLILATVKSRQRSGSRRACPAFTWTIPTTWYSATTTTCYPGTAVLRRLGRVSRRRDAISTSSLETYRTSVSMLSRRKASSTNSPPWTVSAGWRLRWECIDYEFLGCRAWTHELPPDHLLLDSTPNLEPLRSRWELMQVLKLLKQKCQDFRGSKAFVS